MRAKLQTVAAILSALVMAGCTVQAAAPSGPRPVLSPKQVRLYQKHPRRYEDVRLITVAITPGMGWDERADANAAFDAMKAQAAAVGANGLLFALEPDTYDVIATAGYHGVFYQVPVHTSPRMALARAIYVLDE